MIKNVNVKKVREYNEEKINQKINEINVPNLEPRLKRLLVLDELNSSEKYQNIFKIWEGKTELFDMVKVRDLADKKIEEKKSSIKIPNLSDKEKTLLVLDEMNTSQSSYNEEEEKNEIKNDISLSSTDNISTFDSFSDIDNEKRQYWLKYKLYDIKIKNNNLKYPYPFQIEKEKCCYLYKNDLNTSNFIKSSQFVDNYSIDEDATIDDNYNESFGLFFCGKNIELDNKEIKKCCPNEMICKECMAKNRKRYKLENRYLININGRPAKKYNGKIHCFGHFIIGNQIENCIGKFSCGACKLLEQLQNYYYGK